MSENGTVLVTGGSGFLGGWCIVELLKRGYSVRTTVRNLSSEAAVRQTVARQVDAGDRLSLFAANLTSDDGWGAAADGCDYVLHVASPFPSAQPANPDDLIVPAREGALRVLKASTAAGVKRVVLTSSVAAILHPRGAHPAPFSEADWTDPDDPHISPYTKSKTIAERAAWDFMAGQSGPTTLSVVNPSAILGPTLNRDTSTSLAIVSRLLNGSTPGLPRLAFSLVDVRDIAELHLLAMTKPEAAGQRYMGAGPSLWFSEVAKVLRDRLGAAAAKVPKREIPDFGVRLFSLFDPAIRAFVRDLGVKRNYDISKARALGWNPRPVEEIIVDTAGSLIAEGVV